MTVTAIPADFPILSLIVFLPALGAAIIVLALKKEWQDGIRWSTLAVSLATFLLSVVRLSGLRSRRQQFIAAIQGPTVDRYG